MSIAVTTSVNSNSSPPLLFSLDQISSNLKCPICNFQGDEDNPLQVHIRNKHGECCRKPELVEYHSANPGYHFSLVIVKRPIDNKYLVVQEFASVGFWLPGGRVDPGETFIEAAIRETHEEAGVNIELKGIIKIESGVYGHHKNKNKCYHRLRFIFYGEPTEQTNIDDKDEKKNEDSNHIDIAKSIPDYESVGACYISLDELTKIKLRGNEPIEFFNYIANGGQIYPLSLLNCWKQ